MQALEFQCWPMLPHRPGKLGGAFPGVHARPKPDQTMRTQFSVPIEFGAFC